ncbi:antibiotic biosynthesis monooxygenase family protein, partial [Bradyrhizobium sp. STM 3809]|uniref:antibiotic biosynthesis monooxygenase family protein n=1 Tax=Bradyrhizobium sp. STM 3809 TaxID=551936 RepID=UPI000553FC98
MLSLFFEVEVKPGRLDQYLQLAAALRPELDALGGCLFLDRFKSLSRDNLILSYQIWQDEGAMTAWRVHAHHHDIQTLGRDKVFSDYRLRVAELIHEVTPGQAARQPERRGTYNDPKRRAPT